eukprot:scaffold116949_cov32-Tisochrysis_lutea.AAC.2
MNLSNGGRPNRCIIESRERLIDGESELSAQHCLNLRPTEWRAPVLKPREHGNPLGWADIWARAQPLCALQVEALQIDGYRVELGAPPLVLCRPCCLHLVPPQPREKVGTQREALVRAEDVAGAREEVQIAPRIT